MKVNYSSSNSLNYTKTLYEWSSAALVTEGRIKQTYDKLENVIYEDLDPAKPIAVHFNKMGNKYLKVLDILKIPSMGRKEYIQHNIQKLCFEIDRVMFAVALSEGILDMKDVMQGVMAGQGNLNVEREE